MIFYTTVGHFETFKTQEAVELADNFGKKLTHKKSDSDNTIKNISDF